MTNLEKKLLDVLYHGILEIRVLANKKGQDKRIVELSNTIHNIPDALLGKNFDNLLLKKELENYQNRYKDDCINFIKLLD